MTDGDGENASDATIQLPVKPVNHPLLSCFCLSAGFQTLTDDSKGMKLFVVALKSFLPVTLPVKALEVSHTF